MQDNQEPGTIEEHDGSLLAAIIDTVHAGIALLDPQGRFVFVNATFCKIQGYNSKELLGRPYTEMIHFADEKAYLMEVYDAVFHGLTVRPHEVNIRRPDRRDIWLEVACRLIVHNQHRYCLISMQDITERKRLEHGLQTLASTDALTGVANRRHFLEQAGAEMRRARRSETPPAILMIDLDHFKALNDSHGHAAGDRALVNFANHCSGILRESDVLGRLGGEEFAVLLPETTLRGARELAERLRASVDAAAIVARQADPAGTPAATISIGVARAGQQEDSIEPAIHRADAALYRAKGAGRNQVCVATGSIRRNFAAE